MKKTIIASVLGIAASAAVTSSYGQGQVLFGNYANGGSLQAPVTYGTVNVPALLQGLAVSGASGFVADLLYGGSTGASYTDTGFTSPLLGAFDGDTSEGAGLIQNSLGNAVTIASYPNLVSGGNAYFEIEVYNGSTYANSTYRGVSAPIKLTSLATAANSLLPGSLMSDNGAAAIPLTAFTVNGVVPAPEPSSLALAGLGGFGMLMAFRRKKA